MKLEKIKLGDICENPLNNRPMDDEQIEILADSIALIGMTQPMVVYINNSGSYTLLSGHKRYRALKLLKKSDSFEVLCNVVAKPANETAEVEQLAQNNIARKTESEISSEIVNMKRNWENMDPNIRKDVTDNLKRSYCRRHANHKTFKENPAKYLDNNFRPMYEYIRMTTGLTIVDKTIRKRIKEHMEPDELPDEKEKEKKSKEVTYETVISKIKSTIGVIEIYKDSGRATDYEVQCLNNVVDLIKECLPDEF